MLWSILMAAIPSRYHSAQPLLFSLLETQAVARMPDIELLFFMDNRRRCVGTKRNDLLRMARGEYVSFVDDDDQVAPDYVQKLHGAIVKSRHRSVSGVTYSGLLQTEACDICGDNKHTTDRCLDNPENRPVDVICFPQRATLVPQGIIHECTYSLAHYHQREPEKRRELAPTDKQNVLTWTGPPAHTMLWRAAIAKSVLFPEQNFGEDVGFVDAACELAKTEMVLDGAPLYFYNFDEMKTATR